MGRPRRYDDFKARFASSARLHFSSMNVLSRAPTLVYDLRMRQMLQSGAPTGACYFIASPAARLAHRVDFPDGAMPVDTDRRKVYHFSHARARHALAYTKAAIFLRRY